MVLFIVVLVDAVIAMDPPSGAPLFTLGSSFMVICSVGAAAFAIVTSVISSSVLEVGS